MIAIVAIHAAATMSRSVLDCLPPCRSALNRAKPASRGRRTPQFGTPSICHWPQLSVLQNCQRWRKSRD